MCAVVLSEKLTATWREKTPASTKKACIVTARRLYVSTDGFVVVLLGIEINFLTERPVQTSSQKE